MTIKQYEDSIDLYISILKQYKDYANSHKVMYEALVRDLHSNVISNSTYKACLKLIYDELVREVEALG